MFAVNSTVVPVQEVCVIEMAGIAVALMAIVMLLDVAVVGFTERSLEVITQLTACPLVNVFVV